MGGVLNVIECMLKSKFISIYLSNYLSIHPFSFFTRNDPKDFCLLFSSMNYIYVNKIVSRCYDIYDNQFCMNEIQSGCKQHSDFMLTAGNKKPIEGNRVFKYTPRKLH